MSHGNEENHRPKSNFFLPHKLFPKLHKMRGNSAVTVESIYMTQKKLFVSSTSEAYELLGFKMSV